MEFFKARRKFLLGTGAAAAGLAGGLGFLAWFRGRRRLIARELSSLGDGETFDACIIGSGPAGAILALDLARAGLRTVILESGASMLGLAADPRAKRLEAYRSSGEIEYPLAQSRARAFGGTSNLWTGRCSRLHPLDFEVNAYTPAGNPWPLGYADVEPYYERAERTFCVTGGALSKYHAPRRSELPGPGGVPFESLQELLRPRGITLDPSPTSVSPAHGVPPVRSVDDHLPEYTALARTALVGGATVVRLKHDPAGAVTGAEARTLSGAVKDVRARVYVVACGAVESARLLLLSRSDAFPGGLGNAHDRVGRTFMEHPNLTFLGTLPRGPIGGLARCHQFYDEFKRRGLGSILVVCSGSGKKPNGLRIGATLEMMPHDENRVVLADGLTDPWGNPGAELALGFSEKDRETQEAARALIREIFAGLDATDVEEQELTWSHHHSGTCRMGNDPRTSVVDRDLKVHGTENLYVLGSAVFVTEGAAHPTLLIGALAHRLAEHLARTLKAAA